MLFRAWLFLGLIEAVLVMAAYFWVLYSNGWEWGQQLDDSSHLYIQATTMTFAGIVAMQIGTAFACRTNRASVFKVGFFKNKWLVWGILFEIVLTLLIIYVPPLQKIFQTTGLQVRRRFEFRQRVNRELPVGINHGDRSVGDSGTLHQLAAGGQLIDSIDAGPDDDHSTVGEYGPVVLRGKGNFPDVHAGDLRPAPVDADLRLRLLEPGQGIDPPGPAIEPEKEEGVGKGRCSGSRWRARSR